VFATWVAQKSAPQVVSLGTIPTTWGFEVTDSLYRRMARREHPTLGGRTVMTRERGETADIFGQDGLFFVASEERPRWDLLSVLSVAATSGHRGNETAITLTPETVDNDRELFSIFPL
jgi:hypothetical protein